MKENHRAILDILHKELDDDIAATVDRTDDDSYMRACFAQIMRNTGAVVWYMRGVIDSNACVRTTEP